MKKIFIVLPLLSGIVAQKIDGIEKARRPDIKLQHITFGANKLRCGAFTIVSTAGYPVKLLGNGKESILAKKGDAIRFKYDGLGRKQYHTIGCHGQTRKPRTYPSEVTEKCALLEKKARGSREKRKAERECRNLKKRYLEAHPEKRAFGFKSCDRVVKLQNIEHNKRCKKIKASYKPFNFKRK